MVVSMMDSTLCMCMFSFQIFEDILRQDEAAYSRKPQGADVFVEAGRRPEDHLVTGEGPGGLQHSVEEAQGFHGQGPVRF